MNLLKKMKYSIISILGLLMLSIQSAHAYLPADTVLDPLYANITGDINTLADKSWPITFLVTGLLIAIGLFKTFTRKAAG